MKTYDTINDLVRDLDLDFEHWINKESTHFTSKKTYDETEVKLANVPDEFLEKKFKCSNGHEFTPDWLAKTPPISVFYKKGKGLLRQASYGSFCTICGQKIHLEIPQAKYKNDLEIFGDEAFRIVDGKKVFVYSFISFSGSKTNKRRFQEEFLNWKKELSPEFSPDWILHMNKLLSGSTRKKKEHLFHLNFPDVKDKIDELLDIVTKANEKGDLNIYSAIGVSSKSKMTNEEERYFKENTLNSALMRVVAQSINHGLAPKFYFERTKNDGWAKNLFNGCRLTLLWTFLTKGLPVMSPKFVEPSFNFLLEIADIVSYIVARYLFCLGQRVEGKDKHELFSPSQLGGIRYTLIDGSGNWNYSYSKSFPGKEMFKNTEWEKFI